MSTTVTATPLQSATPTDTDRRHRVCHVSFTLQTGGLERLLSDFARFHDRERYDLNFLALDTAGPCADQIRDIGCPTHVIACQSLSRWERVKSLARYFREEQFDIVHTHNAYPHIYATLAARLCRVPVVIHTRHGRRFGDRWPERVYFATAGKLANQVVAVSDDTAERCRQIGRLCSDKVMRIWNGVDLERFTVTPIVSEPVAIFVGRLSPEKGLFMLLRAARLVAQAIPEFRLLIVGDGTERSQLEEFAKHQQLGDSVEFTGELHNIPNQLKRAAVFVSSSFTEGIPLTHLEAMACGRPVVATSVGGTPEVVADGETGLLVPAGDPATMADALISLLEDFDRCQRMGRAGRLRVENHFCIRGAIAEYEKLYEKLLAR